MLDLSATDTASVISDITVSEPENYYILSKVLLFALPSCVCH